jgi:hypothetical protein
MSICKYPTSIHTQTNQEQSSSTDNPHKLIIDWLNVNGAYILTAIYVTTMVTVFNSKNSEYACYERTRKYNIKG